MSFILDSIYNTKTLLGYLARLWLGIDWIYSARQANELVACVPLYGNSVVIQNACFSAGAKGSFHGDDRSASHLVTWEQQHLEISTYNC